MVAFLLFKKLPLYVARVCLPKSSALTSACSFERRRYCSPPPGMDLRTVVSKLEEIAPLTLAEDWDNVGLLVEPSPPHSVSRILLTNDLTEAVMDEVKLLADRGKGVGMIVSYHPTIFKPLNKLTQKSAKERILVRAIESRIALYSPHTSLDCLPGGVNDWLISGVGDGSVTPLSIKHVESDLPLTLTVGNLPMNELCDTIENQISEPGFSLTTRRRQMQSSSDGRKQFKLKALLTNEHLRLAFPRLHKTLSDYPVTVSATDKVPVFGAGRLLTLETRISVSTVVSRIKVHLCLPHLSLALPSDWDEEKLIGTVAVCAGSGSSVLHGVQADLFITGEMSHHAILDANSRGTAVILCGHSNTERGFLPVFRTMLLGQLDSVEVLISKADRDPINVV